VKKWLLLGICVFLLVKYLESKPFSQYVYTEPGLAAVNESQATLNYTQAAKIQQEIDRQNYMDDGIAANVGARTVLGQGVTPAENIGSVATVLGAILCLAPWLALGGMYLVWRLSSSKTTVV
jgi:hypothetical protein